MEKIKAESRKIRRKIAFNNSNDNEDLPMFKVTKKIINSADKFPDILMGYGVDLPNPKSDPFVSEVVIAGWVLAKHLKKVQVVIENNDVTQTFSCNRLRQGVTRKFLGENHEPVQCGFRLNWNKVGVFKIYFLVEDQKILVAEVGIESEIVLNALDNTEKTHHLLSKTEKSSNYRELFSKNIEDYRKIALHKDNIASFEGQLKIILQLIISRNSKKLVLQINKLMKKEYFDLPHPLYPEIITRARKNTLLNYSNLILFTDEKNQNPWILAQKTSFIDAIFLPGIIYYPQTSKHKLNSIFSELINHFNNTINSKKSWSKSTLSGFVLGYIRPYHFFYDQLVNLYQINKPIDKKVISGKGLFFPLESIYGLSIDSKTVEKNGTFLYPCTIAKKDFKEALFEQDILMEKVVYEYAIKNSSVELEKEYNFILWIGITGQKRSWLEQIEGYAQIVNNLAHKYEKLLVLIDGWTATAGDKIKNADDDLVVSKVKELISTKVELLSLVGLDYETKIKYCSYVDAFIANAGTGSIVPLRLCKKPGVLHSNTKICSFRYDYPETVAIINNKQVVDAPENSSDIAMRTSYHIHWQHIYQALARVIKIIKGDELPYIEAPNEQVF